MNRFDADIALLPNLGEKSARVLRAIGVNIIGDLETLGPLEVYARVMISGQQPSLNLLWAMVAGLRGAHWNSLTRDEREALREALQAVLER
jgi:DNA transformation protein and related proteins